VLPCVDNCGEKRDVADGRVLVGRVPHAAKQLSLCDNLESGGQPVLGDRLTVLVELHT